MALGIAAQSPGLSRSATDNLGADAYHSVNHLQQLTSLEESGQALGEIGRQFEAMLLHQMLKSMRSATNVWAEDGLFSSNRIDFYQQMLDDQLSLELSRTNAQSGGLNFADKIQNEFHGRQNMLPSDVAGPRSTDQSITFGSFPALKPATSPGHVPAVNPPLAAKSDNDQIAAFNGFTDKHSFIRRLEKPAARAGEQLGVDPMAIIAQAALETGWGKHIVKNADGSSSFNLFGIKADSRWQGAVASSETLEYIDGSPVRIKARFRSYTSVEHAVDDYARFIIENGRYRNTLSSSQYPTALQQAGYATDPAYADKIYNIMQRIDQHAPDAIAKGVNE